MKTRVICLGVVLLAGCASAATERDEVGVAHHDAHWTYEGAYGPQAWATLEPEYAACGSGREQSPIDITDAVTAPPSQLAFDYHASTATVANNGHTVQASFENGNILRIGGDAYRLLQFHYHHPSEHTVDGHQAPLELHLVHADSAGRLAVVGVMFFEGAANPVIEAFIHSVGAKASLDPSGLLPANRTFVTYAGSLTTPPCLEGVRWLVLHMRMTASPAQLEALRGFTPANARPVQPKGQRALRTEWQ